jgi:hypothetical protein
MRTVTKIIIAIASAAFLLPVLLLFCAVLVSAYFDQCQQHSTEQSRSVASKINKLVSAKKAFSVQAVTERRPTFYCLVGPKSDMSDIRKFASSINYELPAFEFYCGFWSWSGRLLLFYEGSVLDVPIPLSFLNNPDDAEALCFSDASVELPAGLKR